MSGGNDMVPFQSRLPDDPGYWDALADRIAADAAPVLAQYQAQHGTWWSVLAHRAPALAAAAVVAVATTSFLVVGASAPGDGSPSAEVARAIVPSDPVAQMFLAEETPPPVEALLPVMALARRDP